MPLVEISNLGVGERTKNIVSELGVLQAQSLELLFRLGAQGV